MDFRLDMGPWETVFSGKFLGHDAEIVSNPERFFVTLIYEKINGERAGALVQGYKALVARGNLDSFIQTIPKPSLGITKSNGEKVKKILLVSFDAIYVDFKEEDFSRKIDNAIRKSYIDVDTVRELGRASSVELIETDLASEADYAPIFGDPMMARVLLSGLRKSSLELMHFPEQHKENRSFTNVIQIGLSKKREIMKENPENLYRTSILGDSKPEICYASYIVIENLLLANNTAIIFDSEHYFDGLGSASKKANELKEELVEYEPAGFPIKKFTAKKDLFVSFSDCDIQLLFNILKVKDVELEKKIIDLKVNVDKPIEFAANLRSEALSDFQKLKIERIMNIIQSEFGDIFGKKTSTEEIAKQWMGNLGRAAIIDSALLNNKEKIVFANCLLREFENEIGNEQMKGVFFVLPESNEIINAGKESFLKSISALEGKGIGFIFGIEKSIVELNQLITAEINIVSGKDVAVQIGGKRNYRVILRPSISSAH